jgi:hypothetical protein
MIEASKVLYVPRVQDVSFVEVAKAVGAGSGDFLDRERALPM